MSPLSDDPAPCQFDIASDRPDPCRNCGAAWRHHRSRDLLCPGRKPNGRVDSRNWTRSPGTHYETGPAEPSPDGRLAEACLRLLRSAAHVVVFASLLGGCDERPRELELFIPAPGGAVEAVSELPDHVEDACEILMADCRLVDEQELQDRRGRGIVQVDWVDPIDGHRDGLSFLKMGRGCVRGVRASSSGRVLAHELVHALGFPGPSGHSDDPLSLRFPDSGGVEMADEVVDETGRHMRRLARCP